MYMKNWKLTSQTILSPHSSLQALLPLKHYQGYELNLRSSATESEQPLILSGKEQASNLFSRVNLRMVAYATSPATPLI